MTMTPYLRPYSLLSQLQQDINELFNATTSRREAPDINADWVPAVDIREEAERYVIEADVPGLRPEDIEITMERNQLTIRGHRQHIREEERGAYRRVERVRGNFVRTFTLPDAADVENIKATTKDGVLTLVIPKTERATPRRIKVEG